MTQECIQNTCLPRYQALQFSISGTILRFDSTGMQVSGHFQGSIDILEANFVEALAIYFAEIQVTNVTQALIDVVEM